MAKSITRYTTPADQNAKEVRGDYARVCYFLNQQGFAAIEGQDATPFFKMPIAYFHETRSEVVVFNPRESCSPTLDIIVIADNDTLARAIKDQLPHIKPMDPQIVRK